MSDNFKALIINQEGENFTREVKSIDKSFLKHGDVTVKVDYSDLNYKDGMILKIPKKGGLVISEHSNVVNLENEIINRSKKKLVVMLPFQLNKIRLIGENILSILIE